MAEAPRGGGGGAAISDDELQRPALSGAAAGAAAPADRELEVMTHGLKLQQQEWLEKPELKRVFAECARVIELLQCMRVALQAGGDHAVVPSEAVTSLRELLTSSLPQALSRLQTRTASSLRALEVNQKDVVAFSDEVTQRLHSNSRLRSVELAAAQKELKRAKRQRWYKEEYEKLADEILQKKPRTTCQKELESEMAKLDEAKKELHRWKHVADRRKRQTEASLAYVRSLLHSISDPTALLELDQESANEDRPVTTEEPVMLDSTEVI